MAADPELHELLALEPSLVRRLPRRASCETSEPGLVEVVLTDRQVAARGATGDNSRFERLGRAARQPGAGPGARLRATPHHRRGGRAALHPGLRAGGRLDVRAAGGGGDHHPARRADGRLHQERGPGRHRLPRRRRGRSPRPSSTRPGSGWPGWRRRRASPSASCAAAPRTRCSGWPATSTRWSTRRCSRSSGKRLGIMAVAISREGLRRAQASAIRSLVLGGVGQPDLRARARLPSSDGGSPFPSSGCTAAPGPSPPAISSRMSSSRRRTRLATWRAPSRP